MSELDEATATGGSVTPSGVQHTLLNSDECQNQSTFTVKFNNGGSEGFFRVKYDNEAEGRAVLLADSSLPPEKEKRKSVVVVSLPPPLDSPNALQQNECETSAPLSPAAKAAPLSTAPVAPIPGIGEAVATASMAGMAGMSAAPAKAGVAGMASAAGYPATTPAPTQTPPATKPVVIAAPLLPHAAEGAVAPNSVSSSSQKQVPSFKVECIGVASGARHELCCQASQPAALRVGREVQSLRFWDMLVPHEASRVGISREHFEISEDKSSPSGFTIVNLSRAGTVRNGVSIKTQDVLEIGDVITIGVDQSPEATAAGWKRAAIQFHFFVPLGSPSCTGTNSATNLNFFVRLQCISVTGRSAAELSQLPESVRSLVSRRNVAYTDVLLRVGRCLQVPMWWEGLLPDARSANSISREHFQIKLGKNGSPLLMNLSVAGTLLNGRAVHESAALAPRDRIGIPNCQSDGEVLLEFEYHQVDCASGEQTPVKAGLQSTDVLPCNPVPRESRAVSGLMGNPDLLSLMQEAAALPTETELRRVSTVSMVPFSFECVSVRGQSEEHVAKVAAEVSHVLRPSAGQLSFRIGRTVQSMKFWEVVVPDGPSRNALSRECFEANLQLGDLIGIGAAQVEPGRSELTPIVWLRFVTNFTSGAQDATALTAQSLSNETVVPTLTATSLPQDTGSIENESTTASTDNNRDGCEIGATLAPCGADIGEPLISRDDLQVKTPHEFADIGEPLLSRDDLQVKTPHEFAEADAMRLSHAALSPPVNALPTFGFGDDGVDNMTRSMGKIALDKLLEQESQMWILEGAISSVESALNGQGVTPDEARDELAQLEGKLVRLQCHGVELVDLEGLTSERATEARALKQELTQKSEKLQHRLDHIFSNLPN